MFLIIPVLYFLVPLNTLKSVLIKDKHLGVSPDWIIIVLKVNRPRIDYNMSNQNLLYPYEVLSSLRFS